MGNIPAGTTCSCTGNSCTLAGSVAGLTVVTLDASTTPPSADGAPASRVTVTYKTVQLFPLPFLDPGRSLGTPGILHIQRVAEMRMGED